MHCCWCDAAPTQLGSRSFKWVMYSSHQLLPLALTGHVLPVGARSPSTSCSPAAKQEDICTHRLVTAFLAYRQGKIHRPQQTTQFNKLRYILPEPGDAIALPTPDNTYMGPTSRSWTDLTAQTNDLKHSLPQPGWSVCTTCRCQACILFTLCS